MDLDSGSSRSALGRPPSRDGLDDEGCLACREGDWKEETRWPAIGLEDGPASAFNNASGCRGTLDDLGLSDGGKRWMGGKSLCGKSAGGGGVDVMVPIETMPGRPGGGCVD